jgi:hypothetical protein
MKWINRIGSLFHRNPKKSRIFELYSLEIHAVGDKYVYKIEADSYHEAVLKLLVTMHGKDMTIKSPVYTVHYPDYDIRRTNLPLCVHLGITGERMTEAQKEDYAKWQQEAWEYSKKLQVHFRF